MPQHCPSEEWGWVVICDSCGVSLGGRKIPNTPGCPALGRASCCAVSESPGRKQGSCLRREAASLLATHHHGCSCVQGMLDRGSGVGLTASVPEEIQGSKQERVVALIMVVALDGERNRQI